MNKLHNLIIIPLNFKFNFDDTNTGRFSILKNILDYSIN
jgi:hypothetical protein